MIFTPENLIENIRKLGGWSIYGLASQALMHYFPEEYEDKDNTPSVFRESELLENLGLENWEDVVIKYHKEIGYSPPDGVFDKDAVNEY